MQLYHNTSYDLSTAAFPSGFFPLLNKVFLIASIDARASDFLKKQIWFVCSFLERKRLKKRGKTSFEGVIFEHVARWFERLKSRCLKCLKNSGYVYILTLYKKLLRSRNCLKMFQKWGYFLGNWETNWSLPL